MNEKFRVLIHLTASAYGGVETHVYYLSHALAQQGVQVTLVSQRKFELNQAWTDSLLQAGIRIVTPPRLARRLSGPTGLVLARLALLKKLSEGSYDRVVGQCHGGAYLWMKRFVRPDGLFLWHEYWYGVPTRGDNYQEYKTPTPSELDWKMKRMVHQLDGIIVGCGRAKKNLVEIQKAYVPIKVIPPLTQIEATPCTVEKYCTANTRLKVVMIGRMGFGKGLGALLEIWDKLSIGEAELHLYGPVSTPFAVQMQQRYKASERVFFHDGFKRADLPRILARADIGLMLSIEEGYGLVAWEYMACGLPFVMTDCGAAPEFTNDNLDAIMVPVSLDGIRHGIEDLVYRVRSGQTSRRRLQEFHNARFSFETSVDEHLHAMLEPNTYWRN